MDPVAKTPEQQLRTMSAVLETVMNDKRNLICSAHRLTLMGLIARAEATLKAVETVTE